MNMPMGQMPNMGMRPARFKGLEMGFRPQMMMQPSPMPLDGYIRLYT